MGKLHELHELGQSIWLDYIRRSYTRGGELARLVEQGLRGVTSNPTIFEKAITGSDDYDDELRTVIAQRPTTRNRSTSTSRSPTSARQRTRCDRSTTRAAAPTAT